MHRIQTRDGRSSAELRGFVHDRKAVARDNCPRMGLSPEMHMIDTLVTTQSKTRLEFGLLFGMARADTGTDEAVTPENVDGSRVSVEYSLGIHLVKFQSDDTTVSDTLTPTSICRSRNLSKKNALTTFIPPQTFHVFHFQDRTGPSQHDAVECATYLHIATDRVSRVSAPELQRGSYWVLESNSFRKLPKKFRVSI